MKIDINQHKIAIGDKYKVFVNGIQEYKASSEIFRILAVIDLFNNETEELKMKIKKRWSWWGAKYDLLRGNGTFRFKTTSVWKVTYRCTVGNDVYDIYGHRGRKHSIFKNDTQVGWWDKQAVTWFDGDNYALIANDKEDKELLISFCLAIDNYASKDKKEAVTYDVGNIGLRSKKFDEYWQPQ